VTFSTGGGTWGVSAGGCVYVQRLEMVQGLGTDDPRVPKEAEAPKAEGQGRANFHHREIEDLEKEDSNTSLHRRTRISQTKSGT
jgi:hypothetical protein